MADTDVTVRHNDELHRIEAVLEDGRVAGYAEYRSTEEGYYDFTHTEVDDAFEGQGIGSRIARGVVEFARANSVNIVPSCPFQRSWLKRHPEEQDLLAPGAEV